MNRLTRVEKCRISGSADLVSILDFGDQPLANSFKGGKDDQEDRFPLSISFCPESALLQLDQTVDKEVLFQNYIWVTGTSDSTKKYAEVFCQRVLDVADVKHDELIIELASNDGTFLLPFIRGGYKKVIGVDPASNIAEIANKNGIRTLNDYWGSDVSRKIVSLHGKAKVVIARNVIPHVSELLDVIAGIENALSSDGVGIIEFHHAGAILEGLHYDSVYHEHLCYFSIKSMSYLLAKYDLFLFHVDESPVSGGSCVAYFSKSKRAESKELARIIEEEESQKVNETNSWVRFAERSNQHKIKTINTLSSFDGTTIGFGASARSQTYLNFCGIDPSHIQAIVDNNPLKQGLFSPGSSIPIVSLDSGMQMNPDLVVILAWNFRDEIVELCRQRGFKGDFWVPFPNEPYFLRDN